MSDLFVENLTPEQAEHAHQWIAALRSGKYIRGAGCLRVEDEFCCLGVACDISGLGVWVPNYTFTGSEGYFIRDGVGNSAWPPDAVREWLGLRTDMGGLDPEDEGDPFHLGEANDSGEWSFERIAGLIERELCLATGEAA